MSWLNYRRNIYSQNGEDGILMVLFAELGITPRWVCEFGASDGKFCSNTFRLVERGVNAVYIESDPQLYEKTRAACAAYPNVITMNTFVDFTGENTLDNLLATTPIPKDFDILSIDIDSYDYQVWNAVEEYTPKVVIIEINSSVSPLDPLHIHDGQKYQGTGFLPMSRLGTKKGYTLLCHTGNLIFLRNDLVSSTITPTPPAEKCYTPSWYFN